MKEDLGTYEGRSIRRGGDGEYPVVYWPEHPLAFSVGLVYVHRAVAYEKYGDIPTGYEVHHVDKDTWNYSPDNLELVTKAEHGKRHRARSPVGKVCAFCWGKFIVYTQRDVRRRKHCGIECARRALTKIKWPSDGEILQRLETSNFSALGRELGVSDNAIRKRLKRNGAMV